MSFTLASPVRVFRFPLVSFLLIASLAVVRWQSNRLPMPALPSRLQDFVTLSLSVIIEALPFVLLGIFLSVLVQVWLPENVLFRLLPKHAWPRRIALSFLGMFLPVCECGNVPLARGLIAKGLSPSESLTFLLAAPILNPITIITTQQAFQSDTTILVARLLGGFLIATSVGWLFSTYRPSDELLTPAFAASCEVAQHTHNPQARRIQRSLEVFATEANNIVPVLFAGGFVAGFVQVALPRDVLLGLGGHVVLSIVAMMALAFIVSICANVDAFFALAFANTFTAGALVSFLVFGPMVDIKMLNLMRTTYRTHVLVIVSLVVALLSATIGLAVNYAF
jgi:hypothetical protein